MLDTEELQLQAELKAKQALLDLSKITLGYTRIAAPVDSWVGERGVREGQYVRPGVQVIAVNAARHSLGRRGLQGTQLTRVAVGQPASITVDTFPGVVVTGHVDSIAGKWIAVQLAPPDNATGNFTRSCSVFR